MIPRYKKFIPVTLRNRLFTAFLILILLPFSLLTLYLFNEIETILHQKITEKSHEQLNQMTQALEDMMSVSFKTLLLLEQDFTVKSILKQPGADIVANKYDMEKKFRSISNSFFLNSPQVYFTLLDFHGNVYTSFIPRETLNYGKITSEGWYRELMEGKSSRNWVVNETNYVSPDFSTSPYLLTIYAMLLDDHYKSYGVARISLDYTDWFNALHRKSPSSHNYYIIAKSGNVMAKRGETELHPDTIQKIVKHDRSGYIIDNVSGMLTNYSLIPSAKWYLVNSIPLEVIYMETDKLKRKFFVIFISLTIAFIAMSFMISKTITKPLYHLQTKMRDVVSKNFKVRLPEEKYKGEILQLTRTFNVMLNDMDKLVHRLKVEERHKEAVHFQMLLSQMNPHFLLNTLNMIKWLALRRNQQDIAEVCVSLGKLLETSLNSEIDMIPLREEIELVESYVQIQRYRHKQTFEIRYEYEETLSYALVPKFSLQPLVENAVNHGFSGKQGEGLILIKAYAAEKKLILEVIDNGIGMEQAKALKTLRKSTGIGQKNIKERLKLLFREQCRFETSSSGEGTTVFIEIPLLLSTPYSKGES